MKNFYKFLEVNNLKRKDLAAYLGVSGPFITQICKGERDLPAEKLAQIKQNPYGWDTSMLTHEVRHPKSIEEDLPSVTNSVLSKGAEELLISYLQEKVSDQDLLIRELYKKIGMLEAKLELARKGETASDADGSLSADAV